VRGKIYRIRDLLAQLNICYLRAALAVAFKHG